MSYIKKGHKNQYGPVIDHLKSCGDFTTAELSVWLRQHGYKVKPDVVLASLENDRYLFTENEKTLRYFGRAYLNQPARDDIEDIGCVWRGTIKNCLIRKTVFMKLRMY
jgi:hypothetical protein